jgi:hypothetical protein
LICSRIRLFSFLALEDRFVDIAPPHLEFAQREAEDIPSAFF